MRILPQISRKPLVGLSLIAAMGFGIVCLADNKPGAKGLSPEFNVRVQMARGAKEATLIITAKIPDKHHIYSTRTSGGVNGGRATKVVFDKGSPWSLAGTDYKADHEPHTVQEPVDEGKTDTVEHFEHEVTWTRPIKLNSGVARDGTIVSGVIRGQMCNDKTCRLVKHAFKAQVQFTK